MAYIYKNTPLQFAEKINNLKKIVKIIESDNNDYEKAMLIKDIYKSKKDFDQAYHLMLKFGQDDARVNIYFDTINKISNLLEYYEDKDILGSAIYVSKMEDRFIYYDYAKFVIDTYVNTDSYNTRQFFESLGIDEKIFKYCIRIIEELNIDLYNAYLKKKEDNKIRRYEANIYTFKNIANGIKTGYLFDGEEFDLITFWKIVPFKYSDGIETEFREFKQINPNIRSTVPGNFLTKINTFVRAAVPEVLDTITNYLGVNNIRNYQYVSEEQLRVMYSGATISYMKDGEVVTVDAKEELDIVVKYLRVNHLPFLAQIIKIIQTKYRSGEIDIQKLDEDYHNLVNDIRPTLVPTRKK